MSHSVIQVVSRVVFLAILALSYWLFRRLTRPGAIYAEPTAVRIYGVAAVLLSIPWLIALIGGPGVPRAMPRTLATLLYLPAFCFLFTQLAIAIGLGLSWPVRRALRSAKTRPQAPAPEGIAPPLTSRRTFLRRAALAAPLAPFGVTAAGVIESQQKPKLRRLRFPVRNLPRAFEGFRIVQLSDIHVGPYITLETLAEYVALTNQLAPDLVALTGDMVNHEPEIYPDTARLLSKIRSTHGSFAILGNHEHYMGIEAAQHSLPSYGIPLLLDEKRRIKRRGEELSLIGLDYSFDRHIGERQPTRPEDHLARALASDDRQTAVTIGLTHHPHDFDVLRRANVDVTLAGHTHGGQIALGRYSLGGAFFRYSWGHYQKDGRHLYVSSGMGHWLPFRLGCPTELVEITLVRA
ncbi:MAG: metallophosphoesterase [Myxococcales bacterium]|nr:metallophosphoesterase [Myxococcales bacterium]